jgi:hypothetical protein
MLNLLIRFFENIGIKLSLGTNKFGEPLTIRLRPDQVALVIKDLGYKVDQLSDFQRPIPHPPLKALPGESKYSPPISSTYARNTHNPFNT